MLEGAGSSEPAGAEAFWRRIAPFWDHLEDRHFGARAAARVAPLSASPVLVVGGGHGIVAETLRRRGLEVVAVDLQPAMAAAARRRRGIPALAADGAALPFADRAFATVVLSSGVVDYGASVPVATAILSEARRVLAEPGALLVGFYRLAPELERLYRRIGVVEDGRFHMGRLFEIGENAARRRPLDCVPRIAAWTGSGLLRTGLLWLGVGLRPPAALAEERRRIEDLFAAAARAGVAREELVASVPAVVPLRDEAAVRALLDRAGVPVEDVIDTGDCLIARHRSGSPRPGDRRRVRAAGAAPVRVRSRGVSKRYPGSSTDAVRDVSLAIEQGTVFGLLGPNGAGKTTVLSVLAGLLEPDRGEIVFDGGPSRARMGLVPQELALYPKLTARENLHFFGSLYGMRGGRLRARCDELLDRVALRDRADERVERYSAGMKRRLNLAAGLVHSPDLLLLDEPTVGVDPQSRSRILDLVLELSGRGVTVLYTTHYMEEASRLCDRVAVIDHGSILVEDAPGALVERLGTYRLVLQAASFPDELARGVRALEGVSEARFGEGLLALSTGDAASAVRLVGEVAAIAEAAGVRTDLRRIEEPSLESVFLALTGRTMRDGS